VQRPVFHQLFKLPVQNLQHWYQLLWRLPQAVISTLPLQVQQTMKARLQSLQFQLSVTQVTLTQELSTSTEGHKMSHVERIVNLATDQIIEQPYTKEQIAELNANLAKQTTQLETEATKATEKAALLVKLGITDDEAKLLLS
jgi:NAD dependent epimerase/dehydratase family enzyme